MVYTFYFAHGFNEELAKKLDNLIHTVSLDGEEYPKYMWNGSLDVFASEYDDKFIVWGDNIWVTQHGKPWVSSE